MWEEGEIDKVRAKFRWIFLQLLFPFSHDLLTRLTQCFTAIDLIDTIICNNNSKADCFLDCWSLFLIAYF